MGRENAGFDFPNGPGLSRKTWNGQKRLVKKFPIVLVTLIALALCHSAPAQSAKDLKHFAAQGLSFDYPAVIELDDRSAPGVQHLVIQSKGRAQIMIVSRLDEITTAPELAAARHEVVDPFVETVWKQIHEDDPNVARTAAQIEVAGAQATGVRLRAVLNNEPGNAEIYSLQLGSRLVVLSFIGTDKEIAESAPVWLAIRRSLKVGASTEPATGILFQDNRKKAAA
jgi:hypothetical protein